MSHADPGPLAAYNSLQDKHLSGYFSNSRMKRHLKRSGLVTKSGKIIDEKTYRLNMAKKEHRKHVRDLLATAIVHKTLDFERVRQYEMRKKLDEVYKVELVRRVKEGRNRKGDEDILPLLSPRERTAHLQRRAQSKHRERPHTAPATTLEDSTTEDEEPLKPSEIYYDDDTEKLYYRVDSSPPQMSGYLKDDTEELGPSPYTRAYPSTYPAPAPPPSGTPRHSRTAGTPRRGVKLQRFHYLARTQPAVARRIQLQSMAEVTMKFLGPSLVLTNSMFPEDRLSEVMVLQQHCGGSTLCVFRELLPPNTIFTFISRRHRGAPFGLTFYIDGMQDIRLSSCCEYKHKPGHILGGKNGHFQFVVVEGAAPCYRCQVASAHKGRKNKHRTSHGEDDDEQNKTFLTEAGNEQEQEEGEEEGQVFDVVITKIKPPGDDDEDEQKDGGDKVDCSTQTPRDADSGKPEEEVKVGKDYTDGSAPDNAKHDNKGEDSAEEEESEADKYDDEEFEESPEKEDDEAKNNDDYKEDFESDEEKEKDKSGDEKSDEESDTESDKTSDKESDKESDKKSDKESDKEEDPEDEIQDETEDKAAGKQEEADEVDEVDDDVEDETEKKEDNVVRPASAVSAASSESKQSKNVSFDEDITVIKDEVPEEDGGQNNQEETHVDKDEPEEDIPDETEQGEVKDDEEHKDTKDDQVSVRSPEPSDSSSSSSSSSSSESSDSEDEDKRDRKSKKKKEKKADDRRSSQDPGSDPDLVSSGQLPDQALKAVGTKPGTKHEGSVQTLLEGKEDIELTGVKLNKEQFEEVARIIDAREDLTTVILRNIEVDDSSLEILVDPLKNSHHLKMLNLSVNDIGLQGAKHLAQVIRENKSLTMLLLHGNSLTDEGVGIIIDAILKTADTSIMNVDLGDCGLTQDGAQHIARLIANNRSVTILTISGNTIQLEGWREISKALTTNSTLKTLSLDFNKIGDEEAVVIAEGLQGCKSLRSVDLEGNKIGDEGGRRLLKAVKVNKSIVDLTLKPMNHISQEIMDDVKELLEHRANGTEPEETDGGEEQENQDKPQGYQDSTEQPQEIQDSAEQPQETHDSAEEEEEVQYSVNPVVETEGGSTETRHEDASSVVPPAAESEEGDKQVEQGATESEQQDNNKVMAESGGAQDDQGDKEESKEVEGEQPASSTAEEEGANPPGKEHPEEQPEPVASEEVSQPADGVPSEEGQQSADAGPSKQQKPAPAEGEQNESENEKEKQDKEKEESPENVQQQDPEAAEESSGQAPSTVEPSEQWPSQEEPSVPGPSEKGPLIQEPSEEGPSEPGPSGERPSQQGPLD